MMALIGKAVLNKYFAVFLAIIAIGGAWKWRGNQLNAAKAELAEAIESKGKLVSDLMKAESVNKGLKGSLDMQSEDAEMQARAADQARAKERLAWIRLNKLQREISNVPTSQNVPVSDHVQSVLNAIADELRSPVAGTSGPDSSDGPSDTEAPTADRPELSPEASPASETPVS